jgi:hypothetical protein
MEKGDSDGFDTRGSDLVCNLSKLLLIERRHHGTGRVQPPSNCEAELAGHQRRRANHSDVEEARAILAPNQQQILEAFVRNESRTRTFPLDDGVRRRRHPMADIINVTAVSSLAL